MRNKPPVNSKQDMYKRLAAGEFGNTIEQWFDLSRWSALAPANIGWWGIRSQVPGGPCFLNVRREDVPDAVRRVESEGYAYNISMMIDKVVTVRLWAEVMRTAGGLYLYGVADPGEKFGPTASWRREMPTAGREWFGSVAGEVLRTLLNSNSYEDLMILLDNYPDHVVEFSACEQCIGVVAGRNAVVWEVRGGY